MRPPSFPEDTWAMPSPTTQPEVGAAARGPAGDQRRTQAERSATTTEQLISAARRLFAEKGFPATSIDDIVREAGVTRGAMYHHFASKEDLFEAVFNREQEALGQRVKDAATRRKGAWAQLVVGCDEFLTAALDPQTQRILLLDGPGVLGAQRAQDIDESHSVKLIEHTIERAMHEGTIRRRPVAPIAQLLFGALCQAALVIARSENQDGTMKQMRQEVHRVLDALESA